jgi:hypothetical protein
MNCRDTERDLILSCYGDLDDRSRAALEVHVRSCPACARLRADLETELKEMARAAGSCPEFDWDRSWRVIREGLGGRARARSSRAFAVRWLVPAAGLAALVLGIIVGTRGVKTEPRGATDERVMARVLQRHLGEAEVAMHEVANFDAEQGSRLLLSFEQERTRSLGFRNRTMRMMAQASGDPDLCRLLNDLEIIFYETANLNPGFPEAVGRIKSLIRDKDILLRIRLLRGAFDPLSGVKEVV